MRSDAFPRTLRVVIAAPGHMLGGQARAAADIVAGFARDEELRVSLQAIDPRLSGMLRFLTEWPIIRSVIRPLLYARALRRILPETDVLHVFCAAHTAFLFGAMPAMLFARRYGVPVVLNYHDGRAEAHFARGGRLLRWALRHSAALVFPSPYLQRIFRARGFEGIVIPNVVDTSAFRFREPTRAEPRLVTARLLESLYAVDNTIRAFAMVREQTPGARLDIYGDGHAAGALRLLARELGNQGITFHGPVPHSRIPDAFREGGILVNSSRIDNTPHVLIEAMAAGLPIVSTAAGGIPDMVEHERTALLVPLDDPRALADAVLRILNEDGLAPRLVAAARASIGNYSWAIAAQRWRSLYRRVATGDAVPVGQSVVGATVNA